MADSSRTIIITKQPPAEFYKDEGGKSVNYMTIDLRLVGGPLSYPLELDISLYFENESYVQDDQEILQIVLLVHMQQKQYNSNQEMSHAPSVSD
jgi:hypothetical protein